MAAAWTVTSREVKAGKIHIRGTVNFTLMATSGEVVEADDIDTGLDTIDYMQIEASGSTEFQWIQNKANSGKVSAVDLTSAITPAAVTGPTALAFWVIGVAKP